MAEFKHKKIAGISHIQLTCSRCKQLVWTQVASRGPRGKKAVGIGWSMAQYKRYVCNACK